MRSVKPVEQNRPKFCAAPGILKAVLRLHALWIPEFIWSSAIPHMYLIIQPFFAHSISKHESLQNSPLGKLIYWHADKWVALILWSQARPRQNGLRQAEASTLSTFQRIQALRWSQVGSKSRPSSYVTWHAAHTLDFIIRKVSYVTYYVSTRMFQMK